MTANGFRICWGGGGGGGGDDDILELETRDGCTAL